MLDTLGNIRMYGLVKVVQWLQFGRFAEENVSLEPVRDCLRELVPDVDASRHSENIVEFLERALLGFGNETDDETQSCDVQACVETEGTYDAKGAEQTRECDGEDGGVEQTGRYSPAHANFTMGEWEDFG